MEVIREKLCKRCASISFWSLVRTKAGLIDDNKGLIDTGTGLISGYLVDGTIGIVKGKGTSGRDAQCASSVRLLIFITLIFSYYLSSFVVIFFAVPQPTTRNVLRQHAPHALAGPRTPAPDGVFDDTVAPARNPFPFLRIAEHARL